VSVPGCWFDVWRPGGWRGFPDHALAGVATADGGFTSQLDDLQGLGDFDLAAGVFFAEGGAEFLGAVGLAVDEEDALFVAADLVEPAEEFIVVGVAGEGVEGLDVAADGEFVAEDVDVFEAAAELPAEGVFRAVADEEEDVVGVGDVVAQVMEDAPALGHAGGGDDDGGAFDFVEAFGFIDAADEAEAFEAEGVVAHEEGFAGGGLQFIDMEAEDLGGFDGEGAVHKGGNGGEALFVAEFVKGVEELLGALDGEGGDDEVGAALLDLADDFAEMLGGVGGELVGAAAVGALHDDEIDFVAGGGVVEEVVAGAADIAAEEESLLLVVGVVVDVEYDLGGAEDVACINEGELHAIGDEHGALVAEGDELPEAVLGIDHGVVRREEREVIALPVAVQPGDVAFMDVGGIGEHDAAQVARGGGGVDVAGEAALREVREIAAVVDVGVGEDDAVDLLGIEGELAVPLHGLGTTALIESAIEEDAGVVDLDEVF